MSCKASSFRFYASTVAKPQDKKHCNSMTDSAAPSLQSRNCAPSVTLLCLHAWQRTARAIYGTALTESGNTASISFLSNCSKTYLSMLGTWQKGRMMVCQQRRGMQTHPAFFNHISKRFFEPFFKNMFVFAHVNSLTAWLRPIEINADGCINEPLIFLDK